LLPIAWIGGPGPRRVSGPIGREAQESEDTLHRGRWRCGQILVAKGQKRRRRGRVRSRPRSVGADQGLPPSTMDHASWSRWRRLRSPGRARRGFTMGRLPETPNLRTTCELGLTPAESRPSREPALGPMPAGDCAQQEAALRGPGR
jgi:hypothetical protein